MTVATQSEQYIDLEIAGILIPRMKIMPSKYKGKCQRSGKWFDPSKQECMIAFKHKDHLTKDQIAAIYGTNPVYHVTVLLNPEEVHSLTASTPISHKEFVPSSYQSDILNKLLTTECHLFIEALAGTGKTATLVWLVQELNKRGLLAGKRVVYLAFNKSIQEELSKKLLGTGCPAMTTHSFGFQVLKRAYKELEKAGTQALSSGKTNELFLQLLAMDLFGDLSSASLKKAKKSDHYKLKGAVSGSRGLVGFIKNWAIIPTFNTEGYYEFSVSQKEQIKGFIEEYQISIPDGFEADQVVNYACATVIAGIPLPGNSLSRISFDDMLYLPLVLDLPFPQYDLVLTDESQDFNEAQEQALFKFARDGSRVCVVGDIFQCIYRFRGSDSQAFNRIREELTKTQRSVALCELPVNYRSDEAIIEHARQWVPKLQGRGKALGQQKGEVTHDMTYSQALQIANNDGVEEYAFLCRINVPLVITAYQLIAQGKRCCIIGRQAIASPMISIIEDLCGKEDRYGNVPDNYTNNIIDRRNNEGKVIEEGLLTRLNHYYASQVAKLTEEKHEKVLEELTNNVDCIEIIAGRINDNSIKSLIHEIESLFTEKTDDKGTIVLSTVHRSKGLEWDNVFVICPHLMPHPNVKPNLDGSWSEDQQQEENIQMVACTRAKHKLHYICNWPFGRGKGTRLTAPAVPIEKAYIAKHRMPEINDEYDRAEYEAKVEEMWSKNGISIKEVKEAEHEEMSKKEAKKAELVKEVVGPFVDNGEPF